MTTPYTYSQATELDLICLADDVVLSSMTDKLLESSAWDSGNTDSELVLVFTNALSGADKTLLDAVVAAAIGIVGPWFYHCSNAAHPSSSEYFCAHVNAQPTQCLDGHSEVEPPPPDVSWARQKPYLQTASRDGTIWYHFMDNDGLTIKARGL